VKYRVSPWLLLLLLAGICAGIIAGVAHLRARHGSLDSLLARLPTEGAIVAQIDFAALRRAGLLEALGGAGVSREPEYLSFIEQTGFDYLVDLDFVLASFQPRSSFFLARGRFDWPRLKEYVTLEGGNCYNLFCRMHGSTPERNISFFPVRPDVMALAVSPDESAALVMEELTGRPKVAVPPAPVWSYIPAAALKRAQRLPSGAELLTSALGGAESILLTLGPDGDRLALRADVSCGSPAAAGKLAAQLRQLTAGLREKLDRQPGGPDLAVMLTSGTFEHKDAHVLGYWPFPRGLLDALAAGPI
jgi:hypothetical protein